MLAIPHHDVSQPIKGDGIKAEKPGSLMIIETTILTLNCFETDIKTLRGIFYLLQLNLVHTGKILKNYQYFFNIAKEIRCLEMCSKGQLVFLIALKINTYSLLTFLLCMCLVFYGHHSFPSCLFHNNPAVLYYYLCLLMLLRFREVT